MKEPEPSAPGRKRDPEVHRRVLDATVALMAETGYSGATLEGIAKRAGVGKTTIYRWWPSKGALVLEALGALFEVETEETGDIRRDLIAYARGVADSMMTATYGAVLPGLAADLARDPNHAAEFQRLCVAPTREFGNRLIEGAIARGELSDEVDARLVVDILGGVVFLRSLLTRAPIEPDLPEKLVDMVLGNGARREKSERE